MELSEGMALIAETDATLLPNGMAAAAEIAHSRALSVWLDPVERRSKIRFPIQLSITYRTSVANRNGGRTINGTGHSLNISSNGMLITSESPSNQEITAGAPIQIIALWPCRLGGLVSLRLVVTGRVRRRHHSTIAVSIAHYEFRTCKSQTRVSTAPTPADGLRFAAPIEASPTAPT
jgi:hypothetical protein